jgi:hypothetical protein
MNYELLDILRRRLVADLQKLIPPDHFEKGLECQADPRTEAILRVADIEERIPDYRWAVLAREASEMVLKSPQADDLAAAAANVLASVARLKVCDLMSLAERLIGVMSGGLANAWADDWNSRIVDESKVRWDDGGEPLDVIRISAAASSTQREYLRKRMVPYILLMKHRDPGAAELFTKLFDDPRDIDSPSIYDSTLLRRHDPGAAELYAQLLCGPNDMDSSSTCDSNQLEEKSNSTDAGASEPMETLPEEEYRTRIDHKIAKAQTRCKDPHSTKQVWNTLLAMADDDSEEGLFGLATVDGIKVIRWQDFGGEHCHLSRRQLSDKLRNQKKKAKESEQRRATANNSEA